MTDRCIPFERAVFRRRRNALRACFISALSFALAGCGKEEWQAETYPASGQITINGESPEGAVVTLYPVGEKIDTRGSNPWGIVQQDGTYLLSTYEQGDGAPVGKYAVTVRWPRDVTEMSAAMTDRLGGIYATKDRSQWEVTITDGENVLSPIEIEGVKVQSKEEASPPRHAPPGPLMGTK